MPNYLKPVAKATPEQLKAILERIVTRRSTPKLTPPKGGMDPMWAKGMLDLPAPEKAYGQLLDRSIAGKEIPTTMPIDEAMQAYLGNPERWGQVPVGPPAKHVYASQDPSTAAGSLGAGIASERMVFRNPIPGNVAGNRASITRELLGQNNPMGEVGAFEAKVKRAAEGKPRLPESTVGDVLSLSVRLEDLWQTMGGGRSGIGNMWKMYLEGSNFRGRVKSAKDYFIASAVRYHNDPVKMGKQYPREKKLLDNMNQAYKEKMGVDLTTGLPVKE
jgi:hypothetical protein